MTNESIALIRVDMITQLGFSTSILAGQVAPSSLAKYQEDVEAYRAFAGDTNRALQPSTLARWRTHLAETTTLSPNTINRKLSAVKRVMKAAAEQAYIDPALAEAFRQIDGVSVRALKDRLKPTTRTRMSPEQMRQICEAPDTSTLIGLRDAALLATLASSGMRATEAATLTIGQIITKGRGYLLTIQGKNDIEVREAPLSVEAYHKILAWLDKRPIYGPTIFTRFEGRGDRATDQPMSATSIWRIVVSYAHTCGIKNIKPHDFRRFVGTQLAKKDIRKAQKALGHKRIDTTAKHYVLDELEAGLTDDLY